MNERLNQAVFDVQGADWNQEIFSLLRGLRKVLVENGVPPESETQHERSVPAEASSWKNARRDPDWDPGRRHQT